MTWVTPAELARRGAAPCLDPAGRPDHAGLVIDLEGLDEESSSSAAKAVRSQPGLVIGVSSTPLGEAAARLSADLTVTLAPDGPGRSWAGTPDDLPLIEDVLSLTPVAALALDEVLRTGGELDVSAAVRLESLAYSALLAGPEFRRWREATPVGSRGTAASPVSMTRIDDTLRIRLNDPHRRNAFGRTMRDALFSALDVAIQDPSIVKVELSGEGPAFCSGGHLDEFGLAEDVGIAHLVRIARSVGLALERLGARSEVVVHGACVGAGVEIPAFADHVIARPDAWFQLPELSMGLIPGAGGTASISRRIGRWRTAYLALTGRRITTDTALAWGLVDERG